MHKLGLVAAVVEHLICMIHHTIHGGARKWSNANQHALAMQRFAAQDTDDKVNSVRRGSSCLHEEQKTFKAEGVRALVRLSVEVFLFVSVRISRKKISRLENGCRFTSTRRRRNHPTASSSGSWLCSCRGVGFGRGCWYVHSLCYVCS